MANKNPKFENMVAFRQKLTQSKVESVIRAIQEISNLGTNGIISKSKVCEIAGVSKPFTYNHPELLKRINEEITKNSLKCLQKGKFVKMSSDSQKTLIETLKRRIEALQEENASFKKEREILYGKLSQICLP